MDASKKAHRLILPLAAVDAGQGYARVLRSMARLDAALAIIAATEELEARIGVVLRRWGSTQAVRNALDHMKGVTGAAARLERVAREIDPHSAIGIYAQLALWLAREHGARRAGDVVRLVDAAKTSSAIARCPRCANDALASEIEVLARVGRVEEARRDLETWDASLEAQSPSTLDTAMGLLRLSAATAVEVAEDGPTAIASLESQVRRFEEAGYVEDMIWSLLDLASAHRRNGNRGEAIDALTRAAELAHDGGETLLARLADRDLRDLGVRAWRRTATRSRPDDDALAPLSGREREVAGLVASGASNREIAEALVVSPKTIERHITNILAKVGARNRTELATLLHGAAGTGISR